MKRVVVVGAVIVLGGAVVSHAHEPGENPDLPEGTSHELQITDLTAISVAQGITSRAICPFPAICLQDEVHVEVVINFDEGLIGIDAREPIDENSVPVPPGGPGGILFQTQSGPVEMRFVQPCTNPDGCVGGEAIYVGTIDDEGNIAFDSVGVAFELFGIPPISLFENPMGTGSFFDPSDPGVVTTGSQIDFVTGEVTLTGVQSVLAPIVGQALQIVNISGRLDPVPIPPTTEKSLSQCSSAIAKSGRSFARKQQKALRRCADLLVACEVRAEADGTSPDPCIAVTSRVCDRTVTQIDKAAGVLRRRLESGCEALGAGNLLAAAGGLGFTVNLAHCDLLGHDATTKQGTLDCIEASLSCAAQQALAASAPRGAGALAAAGYAQYVEPLGCLPLLPAADAAGLDGDDLAKCQRSLLRESERYAGTRVRELLSCADTALGCVTTEEQSDPTPDEVAACDGDVADACDVQPKIDTAAQKLEQKVLAACGALDAASLTGGLGFAGLSDRCARLTPPGTVGSLPEILDCVQRSVECGSEAIVRQLVPRASEILPGVSSGGVEILDRYPCLDAVCGDGILDPGEECDVLFDLDPTCNPDCTAIVCGDGDVEGPEECDDGNVDDGDGCSSLCQEEPFACGNGVVEPFAGEVCDDSNTASGDGCSANCASDETCGNDVIDTIVGEVCDDGNTIGSDGCSADCTSDETCGNGVIDPGEGCDDGGNVPGDGCDDTCAVEACSFAGSVTPLGTRLFSPDFAEGGLRTSLLGLGFPLGPVAFVSAPFSFTGSAPDANGNVAVTLDNDVIVGLQVSLGGFTQCLKFEAAGSSGTLHCCGGNAVDTSFTRDSNTGGVGGNGPSVVLAGIGSGGPGDLLMDFQVREGSAPVGSPADCLTASYGSISQRNRFWTTGTATGRVLRSIQGGTIEFSTSGQAFDCSQWTTENGVGRILTADTALNSTPTTDGANLRILDDQGGD